MPTEKTIQLNGKRVHYWEDGENNSRTLLLIHGGTGDAHLHWNAALPGLADDFRVIAPDLPGFGKSDVLSPMRTEAMLGWIKGLMDALKIDQAVVIGNSLGGLLARLFAAAHPQYAPAVILVNGGGVPAIPGIFRLVEKIPGLSHLLFYLIGRSSTQPETLQRMIHAPEILTDHFKRQAASARSGYSRLMRMVVGSPMPKQRKPLVPTLILWGAEDQIATLKDAESIQASIPGSVLTDIKDCGHMPQLETTDVFIWQVNAFLEKLSRSADVQHPGPTLLPDAPESG